MDEKPRLKSQYMKKYSDEPRKNVLNIQRLMADSRPAGTLNFQRVEHPGNQQHLNGSRRRILNDFISKPGTSLDTMANRNQSDLLKMPFNSNYGYQGPTSVIGPSMRPNMLAGMQNRAMGHGGQQKA
jgi:hypothetical protein